MNIQVKGTPYIHALKDEVLRCFSNKILALGVACSLAMFAKTGMTEITPAPVTPTTNSAPTTPPTEPAKPVSDTAKPATPAPEATAAKPATSPTIVTTTQTIPSAVTESLKKLVTKDVDKVVVTPAVIPDLYEVVVGSSEVVYMSANGRYLFIGDIRDTVSNKNLTDDKRTQLRSSMLSKVDEKDLIVFAPEKEAKYTISVFTDVDCPYCAKFHAEVGKLNAAGVKVRYFAFPRSGANSPTFATMVSVWCSQDRQKAITDAKAGRSVPAAKCDNPVQKQYELGMAIGVTGTPAMVLPSGELVPGFIPAERLIPYLEQKSVGRNIPTAAAP